MAGSLGRAWARVRRPAGWTLAVVALLVATYAALRLFVYDVIRFPPAAEDMWPNLGRGALVVVNRRKTPERGDVVVLVKKEGGFLLSRVVAVPGDHVAFIDSRPYVDGVKVAWQQVGRSTIAGRPHLVHRETLGGRSYLVLDDVNRRMEALFSKPITGYWVLEDNREHLLGKDSRVFGEVPRAKIRGVVSWVLDPGELPLVLPPEPSAEEPAVEPAPLEPAPLEPAPAPLPSPDASAARP